jgi:hypothetical protein
MRHTLAGCYMLYPCTQHGTDVLHSFFPRPSTKQHKYEEERRIADQPQAPDLRAIKERQQKA